MSKIRWWNYGPPLNTPLTIRYLWDEARRSFEINNLGLDVGEKVITSGHFTLGHDVPVRIIGAKK